MVGQELWTRTRALRHVGLSRGLVNHRVTRYPWTVHPAPRYRPRKPCVRLNLRGKCPSAENIANRGPRLLGLYAPSPASTVFNRFPFTMRNPTSISISISLSFLLASLHSCSPFPRVINHALNCTLSLVRVHVYSLEPAENLSPLPPSSRRFVDRHHETDGANRYHVNIGFFTIELCGKYPEGGVEEDSER